MQISDWESPHRDYLHEVDNLLDLNLLLKNEGYYLHLNGQAKSKPFKFTCSYNPIGRI